RRGHRRLPRLGRVRGEQGGPRADLEDPRRGTQGAGSRGRDRGPGRHSDEDAPGRVPRTRHLGPPAPGRHPPVLGGAPVAGFRSGLWLAKPWWSAGKQGPLPVRPGDELRVGSSAVRLLSEYPGLPRLWFAQADRSFQSIVTAVGGPIHYGYTDEWPMEVYQT